MIAKEHWRDNMSDPNKIGKEVIELNERLYREGATDGLPVVPPTDELVAEMLRGTDLPGDHVLGHLGNREDPLTVERLAANGVMAGCRPIHMPVLVAGGKALVDPASNSMSFSVSTTGWAYLWMINGPIRDDIDIQSKSGAFGPGFRANRTIGRALGLAYRNTTRIYPGEKDMATLGNPFKYSLLAGENEEQSPWEPYHVSEEDYDAEESTITLAGPSCYISWTPYRNEPEYILEGMIDHMDPYMTGSGGHKTVWQLLCPYSAEQLGNAGLSKQNVKEFVRDNSYVDASKYARGKYQDREVERNDPRDIPSRQLPQISDTESLKVLTVGGAGTVNATVGPSIGGPVTKRIELPENWDDLVEEYTVTPDWIKSSQFFE